MECRAGCGACCIAISISSPIPGMPHGKPAGVRCAQLTPDNRCALFGLPERPQVCLRLHPDPEMCGSSTEEALAWLAELERATRPLPAGPVNPPENQTTRSPAGDGPAPTNS
jgi:Fe-S-cluster containining protein